MTSGVHTVLFWSLNFSLKYVDVVPNVNWVDHRDCGRNYARLAAIQKWNLSEWVYRTAKFSIFLGGMSKHAEVMDINLEFSRKSAIRMHSVGIFFELSTCTKRQLLPRQWVHCYGIKSTVWQLLKETCHPPQWEVLCTGVVKLTSVHTRIGFENLKCKHVHADHCTRLVLFVRSLVHVWTTSLWSASFHQLTSEMDKLWLVDAPKSLTEKLSWFVDGMVWKSPHTAAMCPNKAECLQSKQRLATVKHSRWLFSILPRCHIIQKISEQWQLSQGFVADGMWNNP